MNTSLGRTLLPGRWDRIQLWLQGALVILSFVAMLVFPASRAAETRSGATATMLPTNFVQRSMLVRVLDAQTSQPVAGAKVMNSTAYLLNGGADFKPPEPRTDSKGEVMLQLMVPPAETRAQQSDFNLSIEHTNYAPRIAQWHSDGGGVLDDVQPEYTVKLLKGLPIGGIVKDDKGELLANAQILINASGGSGFAVGTGEKKVQEYSQFNSSFYDPATKTGITTDKEGHWEVNNFPSDVETVQFTVIRDDGSDATYVTSQERFGMFRNTKLISVGDLRSRAAVFTLASGFTVRGRVVNAEGKPVAGAKITEAFGMGNPQPRGRAVTDSEGRFQFPNRRARQGIWTVDGPGYALTCEVVTLKAEMAETVVRVHRAKPAVLLISFEDGKPAAGANVGTLDWRNEGTYLNFNGKADADGVLIWSNAPVQEVRAWVSAPSAALRYITLQSGKTERVVLNERPLSEIKLSIRAMTAKDKKPVEAFEVELDKDQSRRFAPWSQGTNGFAQAVLRLSEFRTGAYPQFLIRVTAKGLLPKDVDALDFNEGDREVEVLLEPDAALKGTVKNGDGTPAAGAFVVVNRDQGQLFLNQQFQRGPVKPPSYGNLNKVESGSDGAYELEGVNKEAWVVAIHESGYAQIPARELRSNGDIILHPWERLDGILKIGDQPAKAGLRIGLNTLDYSNAGIGIYFDATTDDEGRFGFERIPAGFYKLFRYLDSKPGAIVYSHRQDIEVLPGKTAQVQLGGRGVRLVGRVQPSGYADLDWTVNKHILTAKSSGNPASQAGGAAWEDFVRRADFEAANRGGMRMTDTSKQYLLTFDKDGSFFVDDVEPGEYTLDVKVTEPPPSGRPWMDEGKLIAALSTNIVIPVPQAAKTPTVQVGPFILPIASAAAGGMVPALLVQQLDGKTLELAGKKGATQAILFWAPWSDQSRKALRTFQETISAMPSASGVTTVAVAVEEDQQEIKKAASEAGWTGAAAKLTGADFVKAFATYGLSELPLLMVVDANGQLVIKTSNTARLRDVLADISSSPSVKK